MILIDFDRTLFDSDSYYDYVRTQLPVEVSPDDWHDAYSAYQEKYIHMNIYRMAEEAGFIESTDVAAFRSKVEAMAKEYLYDDSLAFLNDVANSGVQYTLFTFGEEEFQMSKLAACGLLIHPFVITSQKKSTHPLLNDAAMIIDDNPHELSAMSEYKLLKYRIKRSGGKYSNVDRLKGQVETIDSLKNFNIDQFVGAKR